MRGRLAGGGSSGGERLAATARAVKADMLVSSNEEYFADADDGNEGVELDAMPKGDIIP